MTKIKGLQIIEKIIEFQNPENPGSKAESRD